MNESKARPLPTAAADPPRRGGQALPFVLALAVAAAAAAGCRKSEAPAGAGEAAKAPGPESTAVAGPERQPTIREKADASLPPYSGLKGPRDAALDARGRLWVADFGNAAVALFDTAGGPLGGWGSRGSGKYGFKDPCAVAVRGDDVYVLDTWNGRVELFSSTGEWKAKAPNDYYGPRGIAVAPDGKVWVADTGNQRVVRLEKDLTNPQMFGKAGSGADQFKSPIGIAVSPSGKVYVADSDNRRVQILDSEGNFQGNWKVSAWGSNSEPYLEADDDDSVYASDPTGQAILHLDRNGTEVQRWKADDAGLKFERPTGLALDRKGRVLYVVNTDNATIVKLKLAGKS